MLIAIDGHALVYRAFHALPPLTSPRGELTNATYGFASMLLKAWTELRPRYIVAAFDTGKPTFRDQAFAEYKATRPPAPDGLSEQFPRIFQLLEALHIPIYRLDGYEADDLLGTIAQQALAAGEEVIILTGDTDALQLVRPGVRVMAPRRGFSDTVLYDEALVREKYGGLEPAQLADYRALRGDASDNIPGVPGIGDKSAQKLLLQYGSVENLYQHLDELPPRLRDVLAAHRDQVMLAKKLATIVTDVPLTFDLEACKVGPIDRAAVTALFRELGFRSLLDRVAALPGAGAAPPPASPAQPSLFDQPATPPPHPSARSGLTREAAALRDWLGRHGAGPLACAFLLSEERALHADPLGLALAADSDAIYVPFDEAIRPLLAPVLADAGTRKWGHNLKQAAVCLARHGLELRGLDFDVVIAGYLLESGRRGQTLRDLAYSRLQLDLPGARQVLGEGRNALRPADLPHERAAEWLCSEAEAIVRLVPRLEEELRQTALLDLFRDVEMPLVPVLASMELAGIAIDVPYLKLLSRELYERLAQLEAEIYASVGHQFNLNSPRQLSSVLFDELKLKSARKTSSGHGTTAADVLEDLRGAHPAIDLILEHRQLSKLKSTYVDALPLLVDPVDNRVHTTFNQTVAATGRLSSSDPNLQNIPIRTELGRRVRRAFVAGGPDLRLVSADYSQIELRVQAHITRDPTLVAAFTSGEDIHTATASEVLGIPRDQVTPDQRRIAKTIVFGVMYGMGDYGLSSRTELSQAEAREFIRRYFERFEAVKRYQETIIAETQARGYVTTLLGRRRYLPEITSSHQGVRRAAERMAINAPIQGTASDIIKIAMVRLDEELRRNGWRARMLLQVHDELLFEAPLEEVEPLEEVVKQIMESAMPLSVPLVAEVKSGANWDEMK